MIGCVCFDRCMAERVQVRDLSPDEGRKLLSIIRRGSGSVVRWRRAQIVLWSAQAMSGAEVAEDAEVGLRQRGCEDAGAGLVLVALEGDASG